MNGNNKKKSFPYKLDISCDFYTSKHHPHYRNICVINFSHFNSCEKNLLPDLIWYYIKKWAADTWILSRWNWHMKKINFHTKIFRYEQWDPCNKISCTKIISKWDFFMIAKSSHISTQKCPFVVQYNFDVRAWNQLKAFSALPSETDDGDENEECAKMTTTSVSDH